jgi:hypothetical protein
MPEGSQPAYELALAHFIVAGCYPRDPDGYLIEVGQSTLPGGWRQFLRP